MKKGYLITVLGLSSLLLACHNNSVTNTSDGMFFNPLSSMPLMSSDETLTQSINSAFMNNPELSNLPIQIDAKRGTVYLSGYVKTIRQSDTAGDVALKVPGVKALHNGLIVRK